MVFGTYLSNRNEVNSALLFISSLSFSALKRLKAKLRFTLALERALAAWCFISSGLYFLFFTATSASAIFSGLNGFQLVCFIHCQPHLRAVIGWRKHTHSPPRKAPTKPKHPNPGRGWSSADTVTTTHVQSIRSADWARIMLCKSVFRFLGKCLWLQLWC